MTPLRFTPLLAAITLFSLATPLLLSPSHPEQGIVPKPQPGGNLLFGQKHAYTVVFRNDGAATVLGRIVFKNTDPDPLKELVLTIPNAPVTDDIFYQIKAPQQCIEYGVQPVGPDIAPCLNVSTDHLYTNFEYFGNEDYTKLAPGQDGGRFTIPLSTPVLENEAGGLLFAYRAKEYTQETWAGSFHFTFTSPQIATPIELIRVAVGVDSDLYLKGSRAKVAYKEEAPAVTDLAASSIGRAIDYYQRQGFTKEARSLGSNESILVKGTYADAWWKLYPWEILGTLVGIAAFILLWLLWRRYFHPANQQAGPYTGIFTPGTIGLAFLSSLATFAVTYLSQYLQQYRYTDQVSGALFTLVMLGLYLTTIFGPALYLAVTKGWRHFLFALVVELLFLSIILVIYLKVVPSPGIVPMPLEPRGAPAETFVE